MGILSFLGRKDEPAPPAKAAAPRVTAPSAPRPPALKREEILDQKKRLCGYRFGQLAQDGVHPETAFIEALLANHVPEFATKRLAAIPLTLDAVLFNRHQPLLAPQTLFVIERAQAGPAAGLAARMQALKAAGARVGLRGLVPSDADLILLECCDVVFLDLNGFGLPQFQAAVRQLHALRPGLQVAAENVQSWDEQRMCLAWGCDYCLGTFLTKPDREDGDGGLDQSRLTALEMLNQLRSEAELDTLADVAKHDPGITFQLLKWANAPVNGQATTITSLAQAIVVLGRNTLYRWLTVSMFRLGKHKPRDEALLEVALTRARFLETVNQGKLGQAERDELFLVGLLSLFDVLLGMPMPRVLEKMHLSDDVAAVLLKSAGKYGHYLMLALMLERAQLERASKVAQLLGIDPATLTDTSAAAFAWAQASLREADA